MKINYLNTDCLSTLDILALEDQLLRNSHHTDPILMLSMSEGFILGYDDLRLHNYKVGLKSILAHPIVLRSVGGKAVYNDLGVLNITYILEGPHDYHKVYETIAQEIIETLAPLKLKIDVGEIKRSYCAGRYDLSINHKKIGGIAQKRVNNRYCVSAYLSVNGDQHFRSNQVKSFYQAMGHNFIDPDTMSDLQSTLGKEISILDVKNLFIERAKGQLDPIKFPSQDSIHRIKKLQEKINNP